jgi:hypothetical protein
MTVFQEVSEGFIGDPQTAAAPRGTVAANIPPAHAPIIQTQSSRKSQPMNTPASSVRRTRLSIVIPLALLMAALAIAGFWRTYFGPLLTGGSHTEWIFHLHAAIFMGWLGLVILQSYLAITGRTALHLKIGRFGMAYGAALVVFGLVFSLVIFARRVAAVGPEGTQGGFLVPLVDMFVFSLFLGGAWIYRKRPEFHRRFILLAANSILIAAVGRMFGGTTSVAARDVIPFLLVWLSPLWIAMIYDGARQRIVHPVYVFGAVVLVAVRYRQLLRETDGWMAVSRWIAERLM